jgi:hypothetical protein
MNILFTFKVGICENNIFSLRKEQDFSPVDIIFAVIIYNTIHILVYYCIFPNETWSWM